MNATPEPPKPNPPDDPIVVLKAHVGAMSELAVGMVADGTRALITGDAALAKSVTDRDSPLDRFDIAIETEAIRLIAILQPEGPDLRTIGAVLKIANCVDRVGRLGYDLAKNLTSSPDTSDQTPSELLRKMDEQSRLMVQRSVRAFLKEDADEARAIFAMDDDVDELYDQLQNRVFELLQKGGPSTERLGRFLLAGRHLERVGDNACKIAEKAIYAITGERRPEYFPALAHRATSGVWSPSPKR
ncbi:MAG TPA: phosphate signaling complex protein PhoU [Thermoplasmata archaeon]|nr:phosphate signaling complex protein PhoU [Thermoplasmata archaeon]